MVLVAQKFTDLGIFPFFDWLILFNYIIKMFIYIINSVRHQICNADCERGRSEPENFAIKWAYVSCTAHWSSIVTPLVLENFDWLIWLIDSTKFSIQFLSAQKIRKKFITHSIFNLQRPLTRRWKALNMLFLPRIWPFS